MALPQLRRHGVPTAPGYTFSPLSFSVGWPPSSSQAPMAHLLSLAGHSGSPKIILLHLIIHHSLMTIFLSKINTY